MYYVLYKLISLYIIVYLLNYKSFGYIINVVYFWYLNIILYLNRYFSYIINNSSNRFYDKIYKTNEPRYI